MKKLVVVLTSLILLISCSSLKPYNSEAVKKSMRNIMSTAKSMSGSLQSGDFTSVKDGFVILEKEFTKLTKMESPKGSTDEWINLNKEIVALAVEGREAAEAKDGDAAGIILGKIFELQKRGHGQFK